MAHTKKHKRVNKRTNIRKSDNKSRKRYKKRYNLRGGSGGTLPSRLNVKESLQRYFKNNTEAINENNVTTIKELIAIYDKINRYRVPNEPGNPYFNIDDSFGDEKINKRMEVFNYVKEMVKSEKAETEEAEAKAEEAKAKEAEEAGQKKIVLNDGTNIVYIGNLEKNKYYKSLKKYEELPIVFKVDIVRNYKSEQTNIGDMLHYFELQIRQYPFSNNSVSYELESNNRDPVWFIEITESDAKKISEEKRRKKEAITVLVEAEAEAEALKQAAVEKPREEKRRKKEAIEIEYHKAKKEGYTVVDVMDLKEDTYYESLEKNEDNTPKYIGKVVKLEDVTPTHVKETYGIAGRIYPKQSFDLTINTILYSRLGVPYQSTKTIWITRSDDSAKILFKTKEEWRSKTLIQLIAEQLPDSHQITSIVS